MRKILAAPLVISVALGAAAWATSALAQDAWPNVTVMRAVHQDESIPLRDMKLAPLTGPVERSAKKLRAIPFPLDASSASERVGPAQLAARAPVPTTDLLNVPGVGNGDHDFRPRFAPPDTVGAVGRNQYVQWVNVAFAVFRKSDGARLLGPFVGNALWTGFGGGCETNNNGDPIVQYDKIADRWIMSQFSVSTTPYLECVAVSKTSDATGAYYRYAFNYGNVDFVDYPKMGVWPDGYYVTYNVFANGQSFTGAKLCAMDRAQMLRGRPATQQCFDTGNQFGGFLPSDLDGDILPPRGSPNYMFNLQTTTSINLWKFKVDWANPANTTLTGPNSIRVPRFDRPCNGAFGGCVPQKDTTQTLDAISDRLMYRAAYRNFGDHESIVLNHSAASNNRAAVRWYEVRRPGGNVKLFQSGTFAPGNLHRWMGSIGMDKVGDIAVGYSRSSATAFPSIAYTGRAPGDPLGQLQDEKVIRAGGGSQTGGLSRWGDYSALTIDPVDDCTFWYTSEYLKESGAFNWSTRIASFKFPDCT